MKPRLKCPRCGRAAIHPDASHGDDEGYARDLCDQCDAEMADLEAAADADHEDADCIGPECVNPHPFHGLSECETVEMHEAYAASLDEQERGR